MIHISRSDRNQKWAKILLKKLKRVDCTIESMVEIGCGIGSLLKVASEKGIRTVGYDTDLNAIEWGKNNFRLDLRGVNWSFNVQSDPVDLILCISVLEHLEQPRNLFAEIVRVAKTYRAWVFVSVPVFDRCHWQYILRPDPFRSETESKSPFFNNFCHVVHFSSKGLRKVCKQYGATEIRRLKAGGWRGLLARFD